MKLRRDDKVVVITGRDKGKTGTILAVLPQENKVVVENINVVKRHTKPSQKQPRGGILEITKPIDISKVMVLDPHSGKPARVGYEIKPDGSKERVFKVSANHDKAEKAPKADKKTDKQAKKPAAKATDKKAEKK
ncbi:MAG TPA: 50S ribosomal protein L24 [Candidatus Saccharimonadia bacterium]|jgi:large subunit ribosomal protein L24